MPGSPPPDVQDPSTAANPLSMSEDTLTELPVIYGRSYSDIWWDVLGLTFNRMWLEMQCTVLGIYDVLGAFVKIVAYGFPQVIVVFGIVFPVFLIMKFLMRLRKLAGADGNNKTATTAGEEIDRVLDYTTWSVQDVYDQILEKFDDDKTAIKPNVLETILYAEKLDGNRLAIIKPEDTKRIIKKVINKSADRQLRREVEKKLEELFNQMRRLGAPRQARRKLALSETITEKYVLRLYLLFMPRARYSRLRTFLKGVVIVLCVLLLTVPEIILMIVSQYVRIAQKAARALDSSWEDCERCIETMIHDELLKNILANWRYSDKVKHHDIEKYQKMAKKAGAPSAQDGTVNVTDQLLLRLRVWQLAAERLSPLGRCIRLVSFSIALILYVPLACVCLLVLQCASILEWLSTPGKGTRINGSETKFSKFTPGKDTLRGDYIKLHISDMHGTRAVVAQVATVSTDDRLVLKRTLPGVDFDLRGIKFWHAKSEDIRNRLERDDKTYSLSAQERIYVQGALRTQGEMKGMITAVTEKNAHPFTGALRSRIQLWDTTEGAVKNKLSHPEEEDRRLLSPVNTIAFSENGMLVATGAGSRTRDGSLFVWGVEKQNSINLFPSKRSAKDKLKVATLAFSRKLPNGCSYLAAGGTLRAAGWCSLWLIEQGESGAWSISEPSDLSVGDMDSVRSVAFSPLGNVLLVAGQATIRFRVVEQRLLSFSIPERRHVDDAYKAGESVEARKEAASTYQAGIITSIKSDGTYSILFDDGGRVDVKNDQIRRIFKCTDLSSKFHTYRVNEDVERRKDSKQGTVLAVHSNGQYDIRFDDGELVEKVEQGEIRHSYFVDEGVCGIGEDIEFTLGSGFHDEGFVSEIVGREKYDITLCDGAIEEGVYHTAIRRSFGINCVVFSADGKQFVTAGHTLCLWAAKTASISFIPSNKRTRWHKGAITSASFSPSRLELVSGGQDGSIVVWSTRASEDKMKIQILFVYDLDAATHSSTAIKRRIRSVEFSPDGEYVLSAWDGGCVRLWKNDKNRSSIIDYE